MPKDVKTLEEIILWIWKKGYAWTGNKEENFKERVSEPAKADIKK